MQSLSVLTAIFVGAARPVPPSPKPTTPVARPAPPAPARPAPPARSAVDPRLKALEGGLVELIRRNGTRVRGKLFVLSSRFVVVNDGNRSTIVPITSIARIRSIKRLWPGVRIAAPPELPGARKFVASSMPTMRKKRRYHVEAFTLRANIGGGMFNPLGGVELSFGTIVWQNFFWEPFRIGAGYPYYFMLGGAFGWRGQFNDKNELRIGLHVTALLNGFIFPMAPTASGVRFSYLYKMGRKTRLQIGLTVYGYPAVALFGIGFSI